MSSPGCCSSLGGLDGSPGLPRHEDPLTRPCRPWSNRKNEPVRSGSAQLQELPKGFAVVPPIACRVSTPGFLSGFAPVAFDPPGTDHKAVVSPGNIPSLEELFVSAGAPRAGMFSRI